MCEILREKKGNNHPGTPLPPIRKKKSKGSEILQRNDIGGSIPSDMGRRGARGLISESWLSFESSWKGEGTNQGRITPGGFRRPQLCS